MNTVEAIASSEHVSVQERGVGDVRWLRFESVVLTGPGSHRRKLSALRYDTNMISQENVRLSCLWRSSPHAV